MYMALMAFLPFIVLSILNGLIVSKVRKGRKAFKSSLIDINVVTLSPALGGGGIRPVHMTHVEDTTTVTNTDDSSNPDQNPASSSDVSSSDTVTMIMVVVLFLSCNTLALVINVYETFFDPDKLIINFMTDTSNFLVMVNSSVNYVIYMIFSVQFRSLFTHHFRCNNNNNNNDEARTQGKDHQRNRSSSSSSEVTNQPPPPSNPLSSSQNQRNGAVVKRGGRNDYKVSHFNNSISMQPLNSTTSSSNGGLNNQLYVSPPTTRGGRSDSSAWLIPHTNSSSSGQEMISLVANNDERMCCNRTATEGLYSISVLSNYSEDDQDDLQESPMTTRTPLTPYQRADASCLEQVPQLSLSFTAASSHDQSQSTKQNSTPFQLPTTTFQNEGNPSTTSKDLEGLSYGVDQDTMSEHSTRREDNAAPSGDETEIGFGPLSPIEDDAKSLLCYQTQI